MTLRWSTWRAATVAMMALGLSALLGATPGCKRDAFVLETIATADALAVDLVNEIDGGPTLGEGIAAAQTLLQSRGADLEDRVVELKSLRGYQVSDSLQRRWRDAFIDDVAMLESVQARLRPRTVGAPAIAAALEAVVAQYVAIVSATPVGSS